MAFLTWSPPLVGHKKGREKKGEKEEKKKRKGRREEEIKELGEDNY